MAVNVVLYTYPLEGNASTILEHAFSFQRHSHLKFLYVNTWYGFPRSLRLLDIQLIVIHYSFGAWILPSWESNPFNEFLRASTATKVAFFQDEYHNCKRRFRYINEAKIHTIYSLLDLEHALPIYKDNTTVNEVRFTLTGYVSRESIDSSRAYCRPLPLRKIDVGYRGRELPYYMGEGGQEKSRIARDFVRAAAGSNLRLDIDTSESSRIYGAKWCRFLGNCRSTLAVESGVSVFDLDGSIRAECDAYMAAHPGSAFEEVQRAVLLPHEERIPYRTSSPRLFEAAAFRTLQICYPGRYSNIVRANEHYVPLRKDFSNFKDVIDALRDDSLVKQITSAAYEDLILSGRYSYESFVRGVDDDLRNLGAFECSRPDFNRAAGMLLRDFLKMRLRIVISRLIHIPFPRATFCGVYDRYRGFTRMLH